MLPSSRIEEIFFCCPDFKCWQKLDLDWAVLLVVCTYYYLHPQIFRPSACNNNRTYSKFRNRRSPLNKHSPLLKYQNSNLNKKIKSIKRSPWKKDSRLMNIALRLFQSLDTYWTFCKCWLSLGLCNYFEPNLI